MFSTLKAASTFFTSSIFIHFTCLSCVWFHERWKFRHINLIKAVQHLSNYFQSFIQNLFAQVSQRMLKRDSLNSDFHTLFYWSMICENFARRSARATKPHGYHIKYTVHWSIKKQNQNDAYNLRHKYRATIQYQPDRMDWVSQGEWAGVRICKSRCRMGMH